jgi:hypothetical protein
MVLIGVLREAGTSDLIEERFRTETGNAVEIVRGGVAKDAESVFPISIRFGYPI